MREFSWTVLLRFIPPEQQDGLMLITKSGTEITINNVLRIDHEFFAFRGRLSGSQDAGRMFLMPYSNIDYLGSQRPIKDADFEEMFGKMVMPDPGEGPQAKEDAPVHTSSAPSSPRTPVALKSAVLERFRSRGGASNAGS